MSNDKIKQYYLLCTTRLGAKKHIVSELNEKKITTIFTRKEINLYLRQQDGYYIAREVVVGGGDKSGNSISGETTAIRNTEPVIII